jgi:hypothetical protein
MREKVERLDDFQWRNDPHGERDFGAFARNGRKFSVRSTIAPRKRCTAAKTRPTGSGRCAF